MKPGQYMLSSLLALIAFGLAIATVVTSFSNQKLQEQLQLQQLQINNGVLGQRGQQVSAAILQDLGAAAAKNAKIKDLLQVHGLMEKTNSDGATNAVAPVATEEGSLK